MPLTADPFYRERPLILAHRGASASAPENTLAAFALAMEQGADGIELDVTRCATGEVVVIHDATVDRTTDGSGAVTALPLETLRALDAGAWFGPSWSGERIPLLDEVFELVGGRLRINIEIKREGSGAGLEEQLAAQVRRHALQHDVIISSFSPRALRRIRHFAPELPRALLTALPAPLELTLAWATPLIEPRALHPHHGMVSATMIRKAHHRGLRVNVWTVNDPAAMRRMIALEVDGIITDRPGDLAQLVHGSDQRTT
jgi:glycerophosphoryl diester phosphodiesterase